jgi:hypothetical protein
MFFAPGHIFDGTEVVGSNFDVLHSRTLFRWYHEGLVLFSCFACPDSFSALPSTSGPVFLFCALRLVFGSSGGFGSRFNVSHPRTRFRRSRGRRVPFSCFMIPDTFSAVPSASGPIFMFCAPRLVFGSTEGIRSRLHVLRSRTRFRRYQGRLIPFSCFALPDSFSTITKGDGSRFSVLGPRTHFRRYRGEGPVFSIFARPDLFSAVSRALGPVFIFYAPRLIFNSTKGVGSRFMFCAPGLIFGDTEGVGSRFHVLRSQTCFWRYRGVSGPFSMFFASEHIFGGTVGV